MIAVSDATKIYTRTDPDWRPENLKDVLALQLYLLKRGKLATVEWQPLKRLAAALETDFNPDAERIAEEAGKLLDSYAYATVRCILAKNENFAEANGKQPMVLLLDPSGACTSFCEERHGPIRRSSTT